MASRPNTSPLWCSQNPTARVAPSSSERATGFSPGEPLASQTLNSLFGVAGDWLAYLDEQGTGTQLATTLDFSTRLVGGGQWSWSGTTLAWSAPAYIAIPSAPDANNTIAAGSVGIPVGSVAYVTANQPFSTTGTTTSGSAQVTGLLYGDLVQVGQAASGAGIPAGTTVQAVSSDGASATLSQAATASASGVTLTFASSGTLAVQVAASASFVPGPNTVVLARAVEDTCIVGVGSGQMVLRPLEAKYLLSNGYVVTHRPTAGMTIAAGTPIYLSQGASDFTTAYRRTQAGTTFVLYQTPFTASSPPASGVNVGDVLVGSGIPAGTTVTAFDAASGTVTPSQAVTAGSADTSGAASVRVQRNAGLAYVATAQGTAAGASAPFQRAQAAGIAPAAAALGAPVRLVAAGTVNNFATLSPGAFYYLSASAAGGVTATAPSTPGQVLTPLGQASSATALVLNPSAAQQATVVVAPGSKSVIPMGAIYFSGSGASRVAGVTAVLAANQGSPTSFTSVPFQWTADRAGSVVGISYDFSNATQLASGSAALQQNGSAVTGATTGTQTSGTYAATFAAGTYAFAAGDRLAAYVVITSSNPNGATLSGTASLTVQLTG